MFAALAVMLAAVIPVAPATPAPASPTPFPSAQPAERANAVPSACPSPAALAVIGHASAPGRGTNLVGAATAASEGTINQEQIATRPILRPGEILEDVPGLVISQHSGEGKANQYYLRGFQLDHGTDLAGTIAGIPVNMPTHAHGQGYSDINWLIPEIVSGVTYKKGPYYADEGDFSTAGSYDLFYRNTIAPVVSIGVGTYGYDRIFAAGSPKAGPGNLLYAIELYHDNGTLDRPDEYKKANALVRWSRVGENASFAATMQAYRGDFNSTDQIPQRLVDAGVLDRFSSVDPTDGGRTYRYALSTEYAHEDAHGATRLVAYGVSYGLNLFSNFTYNQFDAADYYNVTANPITCNALYTTCTPGAQHVSTYTSYCPANLTPIRTATAPGSVRPNPFAFACGDQREQEDKRFVSGFTLTRTISGNRGTTVFGAGMRNDNIYALGLFLTHDKARYPNGTLSDDDVVERDTFLWAQSQVRLGKLRLDGGLRADFYNFKVTDFQPRNSGRTSEGILSPKFAAAYAFSRHHELYLNLGESFHSNDARGTTQSVDPQTHAAFDPTGAPVQNFSPLVRAWGEEIGYRYSVPALTSTITFWRLNLASELVFDGDHGVTAPNGPTVRKGIEVTNFWRPTRSLTIDADVATATARFTTNPGDVGTFVPESLNVVTSAGITWDRPSFAASLRYRYFGPRVLDQLGAAVSTPTSLLNTQLTWKGRGGNRLTLDVFNLLNAAGSDVEYSYGSWLPQDARNPGYVNDPTINPLLGGGGFNDYHFHATQSRIFRLTYSLAI